MTNLFADIHEYLKEFFQDTGTKIIIKPVSDHIVVGLFRSKIDDEFDYYLFGDDDFIASTCIYYDEMDPKMIPPYVGDRVIQMWNDCHDLKFLDNLRSGKCNLNCDWCPERTSEGCELGKGESE